MTSQRQYRNWITRASIPEIRVAMLGLYGFHAKTIARIVLRYDGSHYAVSTIYAILKTAGIRLRDYRDGIGEHAEEACQFVAHMIREQEKLAKRRAS